MPQKNTLIFTQDKIEKISYSIYRSRLIIAIACALLLFLSGCKKTSTDETPPSILLIQYFSDNVLKESATILNGLPASPARVA